jgi:folate-binding protein YgfZ
MTQIAQLTDRAVLHLSGTDTRNFLQDLLTNDIAALSPDAPLWAALLSAQGKVLADMILFDAGNGAVYLDVAADAAASLAKRLTMFKLRRDVAVAASTLHVFAAWGGDTPQTADPRLVDLGTRWLGEAAAVNATAADYDAHRLRLGIPGPADLLVDKMLWLEANAVELHGVSFTKGCYVGQENTARMHHRDKLRRRLLPIRFDSDPGDGVITAGGRDAGELRSRKDGHGIAWMRVEHAGAALVMNGSAVTLDWPDWLPPT